MLIDTFSEWFVSLGLEKFKDKLKNRSDEKQLKQRLHEYLTRYKQQFESIDRESEFDLQGVFDCFNKRVNSEITVFLFGKTYDERNAAREAIISKAEYSSNARNCEAKAQVTIFVNNILDIYRNFYEESISNELLLTASILSNELSPQLNEINSKLDNLNNNIMQTAFFGITQDDIQNAQMGDNTSIGLKIKGLQNIIANAHPVKGYTNKIIGENIISVPVSSDATLNPPKYKAKGKVFLGQTPINEVNDQTIDYAYRHQLNLTFTIDEAVKYLGEIKDPNQYEAQAVIGGKLIATPKPFPPAIPVGIYCDDELIVDYLLLRIQEIMDDGTIIISNKEQTNATNSITLRINPDSKRTDMSFQPIDTISAKDMLITQKLLLKAEMGKKLKFKLLEKQAVFMELQNLSKSEEEISLRQLRIETLESIILIENYFKTKLPLPEQMTDEDCRWIIHCGNLIKGEKINVPWTSLKMPITIVESTKDNIQKTAHDYTYIGSVAIKLWDKEYHLPIAITYKNAMLKDADRIIPLLNQMEVGDEYSITFIPDNEKGESIHQLYERGAICPEEKT